jgi:hypothetical protein
MSTYRSCYASNFRTKGKKINAWISYKTKVYQKSKNINISIDDLQVSADENSAMAVFIQSYSSSILKDKGKKTLKLRKITDACYFSLITPAHYQKIHTNLKYLF